MVGIIEKLMRDFLWEGAEHSGADHLVSWNEVCKSRSHGGLGYWKFSAAEQGFSFQVVVAVSYGEYFFVA